jgi:hypothetical protein
MRKLAMVGAALVAAGSSLVPAATADAAPDMADPAPYCGITWGSQVKSHTVQSTASVHDLRAGRHECFDRLVVDLGPGTLAGYHVQYVPVVTQDGSGTPVPLAGAAYLQVTALAFAHDGHYYDTYLPPDPLHAVNVNGYSTFRQVAWLGGFEGSSTIGLGVRARLPFRVQVLTGPGDDSRLVIDVAHRW